MCSHVTIDEFYDTGFEGQVANTIKRLLDDSGPASIKLTKPVTILAVRINRQTRITPIFQKVFGLECNKDDDSSHAANN